MGRRGRGGGELRWRMIDSGSTYLDNTVSELNQNENEISRAAARAAVLAHQMSAQRARRRENNNTIKNGTQRMYCGETLLGFLFFLPFLLFLGLRRRCRRRLTPLADLSRSVAICSSVLNLILLSKVGMCNNRRFRSVLSQRSMRKNQMSREKLWRWASVSLSPLR